MKKSRRRPRTVQSLLMRVPSLSCLSKRGRGSTLDTRRAVPDLTRTVTAPER